MKNLLMRRGVPFLLFLGCLSMISGGFLVFQIWGVPGLAGAASALSTPDEPPALDGPPTLPPPAPGDQPAAPAKTPEPPASAKQAAPGGDKPVALPAPHEEAQPESAPAEPSVAPVPAKTPAPAPQSPAVAPKTVPVAKAVPEAAKPAAPKAAPKAGPKPVTQEKAPVAPKAIPAAKPAPAVQPAVPQAGADTAVKPMARKGRRGGRKAKADVVPSEIPQEWNWFQRPLELQLVEGRIRIVADGSAPVAVVEAAPARIEVPTPTDESAKASVPANDGGAQVLLAAPQAPGADPEGAPFGAALGKMIRARERRAVAAEKAHVVLPSQGGSTEKVPQALIKLQKVIGDLALAAPSPASDESSRPATLHQVEHDSLAPSAAGDEALEADAASGETTARDSGRFGMGLREILKESGWRAP